MFDLTFLDSTLEMAARADFLKEKYEGELKKRKFEWERVLSADPTNNKEYLQWIIKQILVNKFKDEDLYKMRASLALFNKFKSKFDVAHRDINKLAKYSDLYHLVKPYEGKKTKNESDKDMERLFYEQDEATLVYNDATTKIVIPKTHRASCYFGVNTQWCTAARDDDRNFKMYSKKSPLYIILDKKNNRRYQFWFTRDSQLLDEHDEGIDFNLVTPEVYANMQRVFAEQAKKYKIASLIPYSEDELYKIIASGKGSYAIYDHVGVTDNLIIRLIKNQKYKPARSVIDRRDTVGKKVFEAAFSITPPLSEDALILQSAAVERGDFPKSMYTLAFNSGNVHAITDLAAKRNAPIELLKAIADGYADNKFVRIALLRNPKAPRRLLDKYSATIEVRKKNAAAAKGEELDKYIKDPDESVREEAARNKSITEEQLKVLVKDPEEGVQEVTLNSSRCTPGVLIEYLSGMTTRDGRDLVLSHPNATFEVFKYFIDNKIQPMANSARYIASLRGIPPKVVSYLMTNEDPSVVLETMRRQEVPAAALKKALKHADEDVRARAKMELEDLED